MEIKGLLVKKFKRETQRNKQGEVIQVGEGKYKRDLVKMGFVLDLGGKYKKILFIETSNVDVMSFLEDTSINTEVTVNVSVASREWNEKYFTSVSALSISSDKNYSKKESYQAVSSSNGYDNSRNNDDLPF